MLLFPTTLFAQASTPAGPPVGFRAYFSPYTTYTHTMTTAEGASVNVVYNRPGVAYEGIKFYVRKSGITTVWQGPTAVPSTVGPSYSGSTFNSSSAGWAGAGTYELWFVAKSTGTGLYDQTSNTLTLTVT